MPGKSRQRKDKHHQQSKKKKGRQNTSAVISRRETVARSNKPAAVPVEVTTASLATPSPAVVKNPELVAELRRIGILAGIMLAALILLALVLR